MTNEEKAVGIGLNVRDNLVCSGVKRHIAEQFSAIAQETALQMAQWKDAQYSEWIADMMDCPPCQLSGIDDEVCLNTDCETFCGTKECTDKRCWRRYFEYKMRESND